MTSEQVERITDPATIRNIDWSDHYETTTPRGATPMFDAAQDLSEREADANALEAYRVMVATQADRITALMGGCSELNTDVHRLERALEQAEARVDQLTDLLTLRTEALNRTGAHNDQMRAQLGVLARELLNLADGRFTDIATRSALIALSRAADVALAAHLAKEPS